MNKRNSQQNNKHSRGASYRGYSRRKVDVRELRKRFLIVCEGEETEPNYFRSFRTPGLVIAVHGIGANPSRLVEKAKELHSQDEYDQIWCVFDRDSWSKQDFNNAIQNAKVQGFDVAYSNEAFELWYILHFEYLNTGLPREEYKKKLSKLLGQEYKKNSETIYDQIKNRQSKAIKNAERLLNEYESPKPSDDNPSTTVHKLVQQLNQAISNSILL
ncbi:MAG: RloB domain-containing protein [Hapalosiphonaceae cyanobacterium JJU2]|nr:MAG: RloB domain-containing protein [Hapalosiphonaceae cyanobacterium JJU2]